MHNGKLFENHTDVSCISIELLNKVKWYISDINTIVIYH